VYVTDTDSVRTSQWTQCVNVTNEIRWVLLRQTMVIWHTHTHTHTHTTHSHTHTHTHSYCSVL